MWDRIQKLLDSIGSGISLWAFFGGSVAVGAVTGWLASRAAWLNAYGAIAWWGASLCAAVIFAYMAFGVAVARERWIRGSIHRRWANRAVDRFNPLDSEFVKLRMRIADHINPWTGRIENKHFTDCELLGPANLTLTPPGRMYANKLFDCDILAVRGGAYGRTVVAVVNCEFVRCTLFGCTILAGPQTLPGLMDIPGAVSLSLTGNAEYDSRELPPAPWGKGRD